ncbi:hypothetical protein OC834_002292 [Tilletia horrida]|nr:hypothetical protein OC834_002292 [Tilletia horrida]
MQISSLLAASLALLASASVSHAAPVDTAAEPRQIGPYPYLQYPASYSPTWQDTTLLAPTDFKAVNTGGCTYDVSFRRDVRDKTYKMQYNSVWNARTEVEHREPKIPSSYGYRGETGADGRREYFAIVDNACSTFYVDKRKPEKFRIYFTNTKNPRNSYWKIGF